MRVEDDWEQMATRQLRVESLAVKRKLYVCYITAIFRVRNSVRLLQFLC
jgi:hypothetical protein